MKKKKNITYRQDAGQCAKATDNLAQIGLGCEIAVSENWKDQNDFFIIKKN